MSTIPKRLSVIIRNFYLFVIIISSHSCSHDPIGIEKMDKVCYFEEVVPILNSCKECHDGNTTEGFDASSYETIMLSVKAGDPKGSSLYRAITDINGEHFMPPVGPLTLNERSIIEVWIAQGADSTRCTSDTSGNGGEAKACSDSTYFVQQVLPLFISSCAYPNDIGNCHDGIPQGGEDELAALNNYGSIRSNRFKAYNAVTGHDEDFMPPQPFPPLSSAEIAVLKKWIDEGAVNNSCSEAGCADTTLLASLVYNDKISKLLATNCVNCHNSKNSLGTVNLETFVLAKYYAETIKTGTSTNYLVGTIRHRSGYSPMPYMSPPLSECDIRKIELWIDLGIHEN